MNIMSLISSNELCKCNLQMYGATSFTNAAMHKGIKPDSMGWVYNSTHIFIQYIISHGCANEMEDENDCKLIYSLPLKSKKVRINYLTIQYRIHHKYLHIQKIKVTSIPSEIELRRLKWMQSCMNPFSWLLTRSDKRLNDYYLYHGCSTNGSGLE